MSFLFSWKLSLSPNTYNNLIPFKTHKAIRNSVWSMKEAMCNMMLKNKLFLDITSLFMFPFFKKDPIVEDFSHTKVKNIQLIFWFKFLLKIS